MQVQRKFVYFKMHLTVQLRSVHIQLEVINLQFKDKLKGKYQSDLLKFYKFLSNDKYA